MSGEKTTRDATLPIRNMASVSVLKLAGLAGMPIEELDRRVEGADKFLPDWPEAGIRNMMGNLNYCMGLVSPVHPVNPLSKIKEEYDHGTVSEKYLVIGSYIWFKVVNVAPVIAKDELNAYTYNLMCRAVEYSIDKMEDDTPVVVSRSVKADCRRIAMERLMNKAAVSVSFHDVVLDLANEVFLCDTTSPVILGRIKSLFHYIVTGNFGKDAMGIIEVVEEGKVDSGQSCLPASLMERGHIAINLSLSAGRTRYKAVLESIFPGKSTADMQKLMGINEPGKANDFIDLLLENDERDFTSVGAGLTLSTTLDHLMDDIIEVCRTKAEKSNSITGSRISGIVDAFEKLRDLMGDLAVAPAVSRISFKETGGTALTYTFEEKQIPMSIITKSYDTVCEILLGLNPLPSGRQAEDIPAATTLKSVICTVSVGIYDVKLQFTPKGFKIVSVNPGSKHPGLVPMEVGIHFMDITERIENTVGVYKTIEDAFPDLCVYCSLYSYMAGVLYSLSRNTDADVD